MIGETPTRRTRILVIKNEYQAQQTWEVAATEIFSFHAHWLGKRSYMCPRRECPACEQHIGAKWIGLLLVYAIDEKGVPTSRGIIELTEAAYHRLREAAEAINAEITQGLRFRCTRRNKRAPLQFETRGCAGGRLAADGERSMRALTDAAATLYGLPSLQDAETIPQWCDRVEESARALLRRSLQTLL